MSKLELIDSDVIYMNPDPAHYHVSAFYPRPLQLSQKEFICTYSRGAGMCAPDMNIALTRSLDGGVTWKHEKFLHDHTGDDRPYSYCDGMISMMGDGRIVVIAMRADRSDPHMPFVSETGGLLANEPVLFFSWDKGHTWTAPLAVTLPKNLVATPANPVLELEDGRWFASFDRWHGYDEPRPAGLYKDRMIGLFSSDRGQTWGDLVVMADGEPDGQDFWHGKTIRLSDGRLYTLYQAADVNNEKGERVFLPLHCAFADSTGRNWSKPAPTLIPGQTNWPAELPNGNLCAIYSYRETERPGFMAVLSKDGGITWDLDNQVRLWDATGNTHLGISRHDTFPRSRETMAYGAPTLMTTLNGELYAAWWCTFASITHTRWARLRTVA
jgi:hypothetical protein